MVQKTIQCRLVASKATRQALWALAAEKNTPLINELIHGIINHPDFEIWRQKGRHPSDVVSQLCCQLKTEPHFSGQPARFYMSAEKMVNYIFKSWFKIQSRLQQLLSGKQKWLEILQSDEELTELCGQNLEKMRETAAQVLTQIEKTLEKGGVEQASDSRKKASIRSHLFKQHNSAKQPLARCATAYLLKNGCRIPDKPEDLQKFSLRRRRTELQIQRLQEQIEGRVPKGRDLTGQAWLSTLLTAVSTVPKDNQEFRQWQARLLARPSSKPFTILFETNEDLVWSRNVKGRLCVRFNGLTGHTFQIYCDQRQLHWFKRFLEDQQTKRTSKNKHSSALFSLRSARISWQESEQTGDPWDVHYLSLSCTIDVRLWSAEGTDEVRQEKAVDIGKVLTRLNEKDCLSDTQEAYARRLNSTLEKINSPFDRPSQPRYDGKTHIIVGLSLGWDKPLTLAVCNVNTQEVLVYRSFRQLLGKNYLLFQKQRQEQQKQSHARHKAQRQGKGNQFGTSNLGEHIDRLLAKTVVAIAKQYNAGSIAIPKLDNIRENLQAEIDAKAEQKIPGYLEAQKRYTKQYRQTINRWSYGRLIDQISSKAAQLGIVVEEAKQPTAGSFQEKARAVAIDAYQHRQLVH